MMPAATPIYHLPGIYLVEARLLAQGQPGLLVLRLERVLIAFFFLL